MTEEQSDTSLLLDWTQAGVWNEERSHKVEIAALTARIDYWQVLACANRKDAEDAQAQRDKALVALNAIKEYWKEDITDRAMFDACWFAKNIAESVLKECWKPKVEK